MASSAGIVFDPRLQRHKLEDFGRDRPLRAPIGDAIAAPDPVLASKRAARAEIAPHGPAYGSVI